MANTKYTYSLSDDTLNGIIDSERLSLEIEESSITTSLYYIETNGDVLDIWFKDSLLTTDVNTLEDLLEAHTGEPMPEEAQEVILAGEKRGPSGDLIIAQSFPELGMVQIRKDYKFTAGAGVQTFHDVEVTTEIRISGGKRWILNVDDAHPDDYMEFALVDKNDVLGYFAYYGLTVGVDVLELKKFVRTSYVVKGNKSDGYMCAYEPSSIHGDPIAPGLFMRAAYSSHGETDINCIYTLLFYEE